MMTNISARTIGADGMDEADPRPREQIGIEGGQRDLRKICSPLAENERATAICCGLIPRAPL